MNGGEKIRIAKQRKFSSIDHFLNCLCFKTLTCIGHVVPCAVAAVKESLQIKQRMEEDATNLYEDAIGAVRLRQYFLGGLESRGSAMDDSKLTGTIVPIPEIFLILKIGGPDTLFDNIQKLDRHSVENMFLYLRNVAWDLN